MFGIAFGLGSSLDGLGLDRTTSRGKRGERRDRRKRTRGGNRGSFGDFHGDSGDVEGGSRGASEVVLQSNLQVVDGYGQLHCSIVRNKIKQKDRETMEEKV